MTREKLIEKAREFEKKNERITWKPHDFPEDMTEDGTIDELISEGKEIKPFGLVYKFTIQECDEAIKELEEEK